MAGFKFYRKGFSPLVATVLLIAFSVALTTAMINWRGIFLSKSADACSNMNFEVETFEDTQFCYRELPGAIEADFIVKNTGSSDIIGLSIIFIGENGKKIFDVNNIIIKKRSLFNAKDLKIDYDSNNYGNIKKVYISTMNSDGIKDICPNLLLGIEEIKKC